MMICPMKHASASIGVIAASLALSAPIALAEPAASAGVIKCDANLRSLREPCRPGESLWRQQRGRRGDRGRREREDQGERALSERAQGEARIHLERPEGAAAA